LKEPWKIPVGPVICQPHTLDLWHCDLALDAERIRDCEQLLSADEKQRAERLVFAGKRQEFIVTRACLRQVLSAQLDCSAQELTFVKNSHGKPELSEKFAVSRLQFNLAHSHGRAILAVTSAATVGVDLEMLREGTDCMALARRFFSATEQQALQGLQGDAQRRAFFSCWTRKEAFVKALGNGISYGLDKFSVPVSPGINSGAINCTKSGRPWSFYDLPVDAGFYAAVVTEEAHAELRFWQFC
jgi:4'-phosphopantetheinyl transferase